ncbi:atypical chemokine receptor 3-like, partial [Etheostoma cragini]|uniref:atypical chemokine receptor 3-like n=1 Tax=Etheostoma cragini TaxID=417921 RepID=UPI00155E0955
NLRLCRSHHDGFVCRPVYPPDNPRGWMVAVQLSFTVLGFAVPLPVLAVSYLLLAAAVPGGSPERRVILAYIVVFVACWLPFHAVLVLDAVATGGALGFSCRLEGFLDVALQLTQCCSLLHCCVNPVLYSFLSRGDRYRLVKDAIAKFSAKTGLARLLVVPGSHARLAGDEEDEDEEDTVVQDISSL